jgi:hypothetical protein
MRWNTESALWEVIMFLIGIAVAMAGVLSGSLLHAIIFGALGGIILARIISTKIGARLGDVFYYSREKLERPAKRLDYLKGLIEEERYAEAVDGLKLVLLRDFMDTEARLLLIRVYRETSGHAAEAAQTGREFFDHPGHTSNRDNVEMLLFLGDVLPPEEAVEYLRREIERGHYSSYDRRILRNRLDALAREIKHSADGKC